MVRRATHVRAGHVVVGGRGSSGGCSCGCFCLHLLLQGELRLGLLGARLLGPRRGGLAPALAPAAGGRRRLVRALHGAVAVQALLLQQALRPSVAPVANLVPLQNGQPVLELGDLLVLGPGRHAVQLLDLLLQRRHLLLVAHWTLEWILSGHHAHRLRRLRGCLALRAVHRAVHAVHGAGPRPRGPM